jgi:hypothetical protein
MLSGALALALFFADVAASPAPARREELLFANCPRQAGEYEGSFRGHVVLQREFLGADDPRASIVQQLRYLWGHYRNDADAHRAMQVVLSAEAPQVRIVSRREVPYGLDLPLPYPTKDPRLAIDDPYTRRAVARGQVKASDPAWLIEYEIRFRVALCGRGQDPPAVAHVPLPRDPWLAYWHVAAEKHRPLRYFNSRAVTNPCSDDDFADLPHPFYYWYDWLPTRNGPDDAGKFFDCRKLLKEGDHYNKFQVALERVSSASHDFGRLKKQLGSAPLTATILIGVVDHSVTDLKLPEWRALLGDSGDLTSRAASALEQPPTKERGTRSFVDALKEIRALMTVEKFATKIDDGYLVVELNGRLKLSNRPLRARVWLGLTDIFGPTPPHHWRILRQALAEDQIVIYYGHSGIGENFRLAQIEKNLGISHEVMSAELKKSPLRLVAFISCYSYMYFGQDLLAAGAERNDGGYFLFTGMEHSQHEAGPLAVIDLVDRVLADSSGRIDKEPLLGDDEFWLIKEVTRAK